MRQGKYILKKKKGWMIDALTVVNIKENAISRPYNCDLKVQMYEGGKNISCSSRNFICNANAIKYKW